LLGEAGINILAAQLSQDLAGHAAIMVLRTEGLPGPELVERIASAVDASQVRVIPAE
jgi:D-3-phosphoglycerate dehydrogenase